VKRRPKVKVKFTPKDFKRFFSKVEFLPNGCWLWKGTSQAVIPGFPYGKFRFRGKLMSAHRAAYELLVGPIPPGLVLDHLCRNTLCVNPDHLEPVTIEENSRRTAAAMRKRTGRRKAYCDRGHAMTPDNVYTYRTASGRVARICRKCQALRYERAKAARGGAGKSPRVEGAQVIPAPLPGEGQIVVKFVPVWQ
jgi:hypothetical protein